MIASDISIDAFRQAHEHVKEHAHHTPLMGSRSLSEASGFNAVLKAESFQRTGSYKIRGPLNKLAHMDEAEKRAGVICSSAGNHAQGVALAAALHGVRAVVVMAENATPSKIEATRGIRRRGRASRVDLGRGEREGARAGRGAGPDLHPSVRRPRPDHRPGDARARDLRRSSDGRHGRRPDRRRRTDLGRLHGAQITRSGDPDHRGRVVGSTGDEAKRRGGPARGTGPGRLRDRRAHGQARRRADASRSSAATSTRSSPSRTRRSSRRCSGRSPARRWSSRELLPHQWPPC